MLKFLVDHNVPIKVYHHLKRKDFEVFFLADINREMPDREVLEYALSQDFVLISNDRDFIRLALEFPRAKIILFSLLDQKAETRIALLDFLLPQIEGKEAFCLLVGR